MVSSFRPNRKPDSGLIPARTGNRLWPKTPDPVDPDPVDHEPEALPVTGLNPLPTGASRVQMPSPTVPPKSDVTPARRALLGNDNADVLEAEVWGEDPFEGEDERAFAWILACHAIETGIRKVMRDQRSRDGEAGDEASAVDLAAFEDELAGD